jgi:hypothetical protein
MSQFDRIDFQVLAKNLWSTPYSWVQLEDTPVGVFFVYTARDPSENPACGSGPAIQ